MLESKRFAFSHHTNAWNINRTLAVPVGHKRHHRFGMTVVNLTGSDPV